MVGDIGAVKLSGHELSDSDEKKPIPFYPIRKKDLIRVKNFSASLAHICARISRSLFDCSLDFARPTSFLKIGRVEAIQAGINAVNRHKSRYGRFVT